MPPRAPSRPSSRRSALALAAVLAASTAAGGGVAGAQATPEPPLVVMAPPPAADDRAARPATEVPAVNTVTAYGTAVDLGPADSLPGELVAMAATATGAGYRVATDAGVVSAFGDARFLGDAGDVPLNRPVVGLASTPSGRGYWLTANDGGIFTFGDAAFHGSTGGINLNQPIVGMAPTPSGRGYWLVASDGGIFTFGDAAFHGSTGGITLNQPIVAMAATASGRGYWLIASDGGIFTFGDAVFHGSPAEGSLEEPVVAMAPSRDGQGYWVATADGHVFAYDVAELGGSAEVESYRRPRTVAMAASAGAGYWLLHGSVPVIDVSASGPAVLAAQRRLSDLGYWLGPVDGAYGGLTQQAVYAFQKYEGLEITGALDAATTAALGRASRPVARSAAGDLIEVDKARQILMVVRAGRVELVLNVSTGTEEPYTFEGVPALADTPPGRWRFTWEVDGVRVGSLGRLIRPKYFHPDGIAIHGYGLVPPYPASHGCVRVSLAAIDMIWERGLAPMGSEIWVYGVSPAV